MKKFREETSFFLRRFGWIIGVAFVFAFLGTLVWINGRGAWFMMHFGRLPAGMPSLSLAYTLWLMVYGLYGVSAALFFCTVVPRGFRSLTDFVLLLAAYLLSLLWQVLLYSAWLPLPAFLVLLVSIGAETVFLWRVRVRSRWLFGATVLILLAETFFALLTAVCF